MEENTVVINSYATGDVESDNKSTGGLVGEVNNGTITNAYAMGFVKADSQSGGLVGNGSYSTIENSFSTGDITVKSHTGGGLVGSLYGDSYIINSYAHGDITVDDGSFAGGLVAFMFEKSVVEKSYSTGSVIANGDEVGGFVGELDSGGENGEEIDVIDSYWDVEKTEQSNAIGSGSELASGPIEGLNTSDMQGSSAEDEMDVLDFIDTWASIEDPDDYLELQWKT